MSAPSSPTLSDSALLDSLDDDPRFDLASHREQRMEQLKQAVGQVKELRESEYGRVISYAEEKKLIERMSKEKYCLIHFYHQDFHRCRIMDQRLEELAPKYPHTLFLRASVADIPFLVTKLSIQVLPCVMVFVDGRCVDRLIGFEELGDTDQFTLSMLEFRLKQSGALPEGQIALVNTLPAQLLGSVNGENDDDYSDRSDSEDEDERIRRKTGKIRPRRGKVGIRNGIVAAGSDDE
ncbi:thioredoxin-like protein [Naematelia encephala]|uniref:Thioredoxin-like protein n=1 Tax=Naematelia encephala TaxID=71784 RepID=A0A1Y2AZY3_9TREE|nr:thioredoxin-like protein [Naematelia encephala]